MLLACEGASREYIQMGCERITVNLSLKIHEKYSVVVSILLIIAALGFRFGPFPAPANSGRPTASSAPRLEYLCTMYFASILPGMSASVPFQVCSPIQVDLIGCGTERHALFRSRALLAVGRSEGFAPGSADMAATTAKV